MALGKTFANHWMHNGFVVDTEGEKMSKSLGNVSNLLDLIDIYDPRAYRMVLLQSHYRSPVKITSDSIGAAINSLAGLDSFAARTATAWLPTPTPDAEVLAEFRAAMDDDLDTPRATALIFDTVRRANAAFDAGDPSAAALAAAVHEICDAVGLELGVAGEVPADVLAWRPRSMRPAPPATSTAPTRSAPSCRPAAGPSRRPKTVRRFAGDRHDRTIRSRAAAPAGSRPGDRSDRRPATGVRRRAS